MIERYLWLQWRSTREHYLNLSWVPNPSIALFGAIFKSAILATIILGCSFLYWPWSESSVLIQQHTFHEPPKMTRTEWIQVATNTVIEVETPDMAAVTDVCVRTTWRQGLHFTCRNVFGGVGNVRNRILVCLRYAIEAGATGFVVPDIQTRDNEHIENIYTSEFLPFEYLFDRKYFMDTLQRACPQMKVYADLETWRHIHPQETRTEINLTPKHIAGPVVSIHVVAYPDQWRPKFDKWLIETGLQGHTPSEATPALTLLDQVFMDWPLAYESLEFVKAFSQILRFNEPARELAATVLYELAQFVPIDPRQGLTKQSFYGAHLRTETDTAGFGWLSYEEQAKHYLTAAKKYNLSTIYVSSGSSGAYERFREEASRDYGFRVLTKSALLQGEDLGKLMNMTFDQQGLVDYEVLLKSSVFGGIDSSTFSLNIGMRRHFLLDDSIDEYGPVKLSNHNRFTVSDGLSEVTSVNYFRPDYGAMYLGMWL